MFDNVLVPPYDVTLSRESQKFTSPKLYRKWILKSSDSFISKGIANKFNIANGDFRYRVLILYFSALYRHYQDSDDVLDHHLSPPSTTSRLSDSDTSECDITDCDVSREQRRTADGASISSIGSSSR